MKDRTGLIEIWIYAMAFIGLLWIALEVVNNIIN